MSSNVSDTHPALWPPYEQSVKPAAASFDCQVKARVAEQRKKLLNAKGTSNTAEKILLEPIFDKSHVSTSMVPELNQKHLVADTNSR